MASLNPFRRQVQTLIASGEEVNLSSDSAVKAVLKRREDWQRQSVDGFDACGLIQNGVGQLADLMSGLVVFAAKQPTDKDAKPTRDDDKVCNETVERLGTIDEIGQFLYDLAQLMFLIGESQVLGIQPGPDRPNDEEMWAVYSHLELEQAVFINSDGKAITTVKIPDFHEGKPLTLNPELGDTWIRLWRSHPIRKSKANSHMRALLGPVDELLWWTHAAEGVAKNRLNMSGLIGVPSNLELPEEAGEPANISGGQRFIRRLLKTFVKTIQNPGLSSSSVPSMFTYPWNESGKSGVEIIEMQRPQDELLIARTEYCEKAIAQGFPLPVESFFGVGNASQFGSREISESKFRENVEPFARFLLASLTQAWYRPILKAEGVKDYNKRMLWYDASNLIVHPDMPQAADKGYEYGLVSGSAWRRIRGVPERDAPSEEEQQKTLDWIRALRGKEQGDGPDQPADDTDNNPDEPTEPAPHQRHAPVEKNGAPVRGKGQPVLASTSPNGSSLGRRLAEIDADLLSRVQVMADSAMRQEQIRAGNKLKNRASKNTRLKAVIKGVGSADIAATLGRETVITLNMSDLFSDSFETVPELFVNWCDLATAAAFSNASINPSDHPAFGISYQPVEAAEYLVRELKELAALLLFDRSSVLDIGPEADGLLVPADIIRSSLALAGGATTGDKHNLLLATGHAVTKILAAAGFFAERYQWWWPPSGRNPYAAHQKLDGQSFRLGELPHTPGDTRGCRCLSVPIFE